MADDQSKTAPRALSGVRVLSLEASAAGPHCTRILGDMGAEVIKIEKPGVGDMVRQWDSVVRGLSTGFVWLNGNKRSFAIDVKKTAGLRPFAAWQTAWMFFSRIRRRASPIASGWGLLSSASPIRG